VPVDEENVVITQGAIAANHLAFYSLIGPGDHVVCHYPTYQQLYATPKSLGAEVDLWKASPERGWIPSFEDLRGLIRPNTKLIVLKYAACSWLPSNASSNPNNPTGAILPRRLLVQIVELARLKNIIVMSDEVYRPIFHSVSPDDDDFPPSILSLGYANTIATGSLSKAYSLAGIRVGWLASRSSALVERVRDARHYTTISVSIVDSHIAAFALAPPTADALVQRNVRLARENLDILSGFIAGNAGCDWVRPRAGTTAFVRFVRDGAPVDAAELCRQLVEEAGVLLVPGDVAFGGEFKGFVRVGFVCDTGVLQAGLAAVEEWMKLHYDSLPLAG
jgi:aspartate/methionine/tyrosine aminotransferase